MEHKDLETNKMLMYKIFFFNYIFAVSGFELIDRLLATDQSQYDQFKETDFREIQISKVDLLSKLIKSLMKVLNLLQSRSANHKMDQAIKQTGAKSQMERSQKR